MPELDDNQKKVLGALREQSMDGYTLLSRTGLQRGALADSLRVLVNQGLVKVDGDLAEDHIGESFFLLPVDQVGVADSLLGRLPRTFLR